MSRHKAGTANSDVASPTLAGSQRSRPRRWLHRLAWAWGVLGLGLAGLALLELIASSWIDFRPHTDPGFFGPGFPAAGKEFLTEFAQEMDQTVSAFDSPAGELVPLSWEPFVYWRGRPFQGRHIRIAADGVRATWRAPHAPVLPPTTPALAEPAGHRSPETSAPTEPLRIFVFGGSTMWGFGARDDQTIASQLAQQLAAAGLRTNVTNFAQIGYVTSQDVIVLGRLLADRQVPRAVVLLGGYNDVAAGIWNRQPGRSLDDAARSHEFLASRRPAPELLGWTARNTAIGRLAQSFRPRPPGALLPSQHELPQWSQAIWDNYTGDLKLVDAWSAAYGFDAVYAWQPVIYLKQPLSSSEQAAAAGRGSQAMLCSAVFDLARAEFKATPLASITPDVQSHGPQPGVRLYLGECFNGTDWHGQTAFFDRCHLVESAQAELARRLSQVLIPRLRTAGRVTP